MKPLYSFIVILSFFCFTLPSSAQVGQWTWMHGDSAANGAVNYGTLGMPAAANNPPPVYEPCEWTDLNGNFWLYGGLDDNSNVYSALWEYNVSLNEWTWISGTQGSYNAAIYGVQGVPSPSNYPGARSFGLPTWTDLQGNLWLYGGVGALSYNDLWMYNISTNEWTWMQGDSTDDNAPIYGTKGAADSANTPGYRSECAASWTDNNGDLWLFGGFNNNMFNDMWRFNIATNEWTWMNGSDIQNAGGIYGAKGTEGASNTPGARAAYTHWKDNTGKLWFFGGWNINSGNYYNDFWRYNPADNKWAWMGGSSSANGFAAYGTECVSSTGNIPDARGENRAEATDQNGNFWMFGGVGQTTTENDLWMYCVSGNTWTWVSGNTAGDTGSWGTPGVSSATNVPSGRCGAVGWSDHNGHLYFYGGASSQGPGNYNDLWQFTIDPSCGTCNTVLPPPVASFQASDSTLCANDCINFTDNSSGNPDTWKWTFTGGMPSSSNVKNPQNICYLAAGNFNVKLVVTNSNGSDSVTYSNYIKVLTTPNIPTISQRGDTLFCTTDPSYTSYQWYDDTALIPGATDSVLIAATSGNYNVQVGNIYGCKVAVGINIILGVNQFTVYGLQFTVSPNPTGNALIIRNGELTIERIEIYNILGENIYSRKSEIVNPKFEIEVDVSFLPAGLYFVRVSGENENVVGKFVKE